MILAVACRVKRQALAAGTFTSIAWTPCIGSPVKDAPIRPLVLSRSEHLKCNERSETAEQQLELSQAWDGRLESGRLPRADARRQDPGAGVQVSALELEFVV